MSIKARDYSHFNANQLMQRPNQYERLSDFPNIVQQQPSKSVVAVREDTFGIGTTLMFQSYTFVGPRGYQQSFGLVVGEAIIADEFGGSYILFKALPEMAGWCTIENHGADLPSGLLNSKFTSVRNAYFALKSHLEHVYIVKQNALNEKKVKK